MNVERPDAAVSAVASAIAEPARTRILFCLLDDRARTSTELAIIAGVTPSTASVHLARLKERQLVRELRQGRHHYYSLYDSDVAAALEALSVVAGAPGMRFQPSTPDRLRSARTCYDHLAGALGVALHDRLFALGWLTTASSGEEGAYELTPAGAEALGNLGVDVAAMRTARRRFACACLDWSERRPHLAGAVGAALLAVALKRKWLARDLDGRAVRPTSMGRREFRLRFGLEI